MAKSTRTQAGRTASVGAPGYPMPKSCYNGTHIELSQDAIGRHWGVLPTQAKAFILDNSASTFPLWKLIKFWSSLPNIQSTRGNLAGSICGAAWYLALVYLKQNRLNEARALTINASFIHQCCNSSIEYVKTLCEAGGFIPEQKLPHFARGVHSLRSPESMVSYIQSYLPEEYTHMMSSFAHLSSKKHVMGYINQISDDWNGTSSASRNCHHRSLPSGNETQIKLILVDDTNGGERRILDIGLSTTLKSLFNDYADTRGISLRSLRFSYEGKSLFLSSAGNKTPEELGMQNQDVIIVHDVAQPCVSSSQQTPTSSKTTKAKKRSKNQKQKHRSKKAQQREQPTKTREEYKVEHSEQLTKIHEEVQDRFREIRQKLNNLVIVRSQPKIKSKRQPAPKDKTSPLAPVLESFIEDIGRKAGKPRYEVQVGDVQNLYKTTKPSSMAFQCRSSPSTLDLHGYSRDEALVKLNESLKVWIDDAMQGSYPFVRPAIIICGYGNQVLSEMVQEWIRSNERVSNAPKIRSLRRRGYVSRAA